MAEEVLLSREGYQKLTEELEHLRLTERKRIADNIREAKSHGDLRENAMYHEAKLNQKRLEGRIVELERTLQYAKVLDEEDEVKGGANLNTTVGLKDEFGDIWTIQLVGAFEADPTEDKISVDSPLGKCVLGKKVGEVVEFEAPAGVQRFEVDSII